MKEITGRFCWFYFRIVWHPGVRLSFRLVVHVFQVPSQREIFVDHRWHPIMGDGPMCMARGYHGRYEYCFRSYLASKISTILLKRGKPTLSSDLRSPNAALLPYSATTPRWSVFVFWGPFILRRTPKNSILTKQ
jgi:hypothetical protein